MLHICTANGIVLVFLAASEGGLLCTCLGMRCCFALQALCLILRASCKCEPGCACF